LNYCSRLSSTSSTVMIIGNFRRDNIERTPKQNSP
jgi:hypothetical protein